MQHFATLIHRLDITNKTNDKIEAIAEYLKTAPDNDKLWLIALFTGKRPKRPVSATLLRQWVLEITQLPEWLFLECYSSVGDLGETISLLLPPAANDTPKTLSQWMDEIIALQTATEAIKKEYVLKAWSGLNYRERFIFNKLIGGSFRVGVSYKLLVNALAKHTGKEANAIMHDVMGKWSPVNISYQHLMEGASSGADNSKPYPFCLAYPLEKEVAALGNTTDWQAEWKWDGIRGQIIKRNAAVFIWSRGEELVTDQFPEIALMAMQLPEGTVLDGEIISIKEGEVQSFSHLQKRLNRKSVSKKMLETHPVGFYAYDILEYAYTDIRQQSFSERRQTLVATVAQVASSSLLLSPVIAFENWEALARIQSQARTMNSEGVMLKSLTSPYHSGRKKGEWWKWKVNPLSIDAVLIYAQKGSGRRSSFYTDYTFAIAINGQYVTIAKAYSGLTDKEIKEVDAFVKKNAIEKFGPVRTVQPQLVFEIGFEGIAASNRHKSGVALRFPRILRWRKDKTVADINTIEDIKIMLEKYG